MPTLIDNFDAYAPAGLEEVWQDNADGGVQPPPKREGPSAADILAPKEPEPVELPKGSTNWFTGEPTTDPKKVYFREFLKLIWAWLGLPPPTPIQLAIADYLQYGPDRKIIMGFRGVAKSWITAAYALWVLYCDPQRKVMVVSGSLKRSVNFVTFCLQLIRDCPTLKHLEPGPKQRQSAVAFDVAGARPDQNPSLYAAGITGQIVGYRAHEIVPDDVETNNNSLTAAGREKIKDTVREFDAIILPNGRVSYLGTPQTFNSIYNDLPKRGYTIRIWPAEYPDAARMRSYGEKLAPDIAEAVKANPTLVGHSTEPSRFPDEDLAHRKLSWGASGYALQYLLDTTLADADKYPLKLRNLIVTSLDKRKGPDTITWGNGETLAHKDLPNVGFDGDLLYGPASVAEKSSPYNLIIAALDTSGRGTNETALSILAELHGMLFVLYNNGWKDGYSDATLRGICRLCVDYHVVLLLVETNFGDGMFATLLRPHMKQVWEETYVAIPHAQRPQMPGIEEITSSHTQKELRIISALEPLTNQNRLVVDTDCIHRDYRTVQESEAGTDRKQNYSLWYQYTHITHERECIPENDRLESLAIAANYFAPRLGIRPQDMAAETAAERESRAIEALLYEEDDIQGVAHGRKKGQWRGRGTYPRRH